MVGVYSESRKPSWGKRRLSGQVQRMLTAEAAGLDG